MMLNTSTTRVDCKQHSRKLVRTRAAHIESLPRPRCVYATHSRHSSHVVVYDIPNDAAGSSTDLHGSRVLVTDKSGRLASVYNQQRELTGSYYDYMALLPAVPGLPNGPFSVLGLGAGTISRIIAKHFPRCEQHGWEVDPTVLAVSRLHLGLQQLEDSGSLKVHMGDAIKPDAAIPGGSAGIIVDLFSRGELVPELTRVETWLNIKSRLAPGGRVMAYLGEPSRSNTRALHAVSLAFQSSLSFFTFTDDGYANTIVLTGPAPDMVGWQARLSPALSNVFVNTNWTSLQ